MAAVNQVRSFEIEAAWERADGVAAPELAATWCALEMTAGGRPVTLVDDIRGGGLRTALHTSAYPLAEWIATHWWTLREHVRPSATSPREWTWTRVGSEPWVRDHNLRAAGDGMAWPDLTIVPEGGVTRIVWNAAPGLAGQPVSFLTSGDLYLSTEALQRSLTRFVTQVLDRLSGSRISGTLLQQEWAALADLDHEEEEYAAAVARLGLDPFYVNDDVASQLEEISSILDSALLEEFLDSADPSRLPLASAWLERARDTATFKKPNLALGPITETTEGWPWENGYALARECREHLSLAPTDRIDLRDLVGFVHMGGDSAGLQGVVQIAEAGIGLVVPEEMRALTSTRFAQARALGISLLTTRSTTILDPVRTDLAKSSRAFAAELLAPAAGIAEYLHVFPGVTDRALDAVADRFDASPLLIQRQHENQLA